MENTPPRRVMIGTPAHDGRVDVWYAHSLAETVRLGMLNNLMINAVFMSYDSLVQRARNDLVRLAIESEVDDLIFIDSDQAWDPAWVLQLLAHPVDVVGGAVIKKTDAAELYNVRADFPIQFDPLTGLGEVIGLGTGFLRLNRATLLHLWDVSEEYQNEGRACRMVFDVKVVDGELVSEDIVLGHKLSGLGIKTWLDSSITCSHVGTKIWHGNFKAWYDKLTPAIS